MALVPLRPLATDERETAPSLHRARVEFARRVGIAVAVVGASLLAVLAVWAGRTALLLVYISLIAATGLLPLVQRIEHLTTRPSGRSLPRWLVIAAVYLGCVGIAFALGLLIVPTLISQADALRQALPSQFDKWQTTLLRHGWIARPVTFADAMHQSAPTVDVTQPIALAASAVRRLAGGVFESFTVLILTFYILLDGPRLTAEAARTVPVEHRTRFTSVVRDVTGRVSAWLQGNLILASIMGSVTAVAMAVLGEPFFAVVALVAAAGEFVPIAGPLIAGAFAFLLALTVSLKLALLVALVFFVLHEIEVNVLMPHVMSRQLGLSTLAVFSAVLISANWFGLVGAILAIPTTAIVAAIVEEWRKPTPDHPAAA
jgi:predicted PurR-regulated permease PerM